MGSMNRTSSDRSTDETEHRLPWNDDQEPLDDYTADDSSGTDESDKDSDSGAENTHTDGGTAAGGSAGPVDALEATDSDNEEQGLLEGILEGIISPLQSGQTEIDDSGRGIPGSKLEGWSKPGPSKNTKEACDSIKHTLRTDPTLQQKDVSFTVYLQGSYKNSTNIHGDSDVDIVVRLDAPYRIERRDGGVKIVHPDGSVQDYDYKQFKQDVITALKRRYGEGAVQIGDKAIEVHSSDSTLRIDADVVVCQQHRVEGGLGEARRGMWFETKHGEKISNYPKQHYINGTEKNQRTNGEYKKALRMMKRARSYLAKKGQISKDNVPSYFLVCLLYNVPDKYYTAKDPQANNYQRRFCNIVNYLQDANLQEFTCQNGADQLFGPEPTQWNERDAQRFIKELVYLWQNWY